MSDVSPLRLDPGLVTRLRIEATRRTAATGDRVTMKSLAERILVGDLPPLPELEQQ